MFCRHLGSLSSCRDVDHDLAVIGPVVLTASVLMEEHGLAVAWDGNMFFWGAGGGLYHGDDSLHIS